MILPIWSIDSGTSPVITYHSLVEQHHSYWFRDDRIDFPCPQDLLLNILIFHHSLDDPNLILHMRVLVTCVCLFHKLHISISLRDNGDETDHSHLICHRRRFKRYDLLSPRLG